MIELLNGSAQASAKLEIEILTIADGTTWTVLQTECTVADDLISNSPPSDAGGPTYITETTLAAIIPQFVDSTAANAVVSVGDAWWDTTLDKVRVRLA